MHPRSMRRFVPAATFFLAACATAPQKPEPQPVTPTPPAQSHSSILGGTAGDLVQLFGSPVLQVREGSSLKMQFRRRGCVLDAYLYPPSSGGAERVTYVDTRNQSGVDMDEQSCVRLLRMP